MSSISDSAVVDTLRRQMAIAVAKQVASAGNLANVDTPGYKTKEVNFAETLKNKLAPGNSTFPAGGAPNGGVVMQDVDALGEFVVEEEDRTEEEGARDVDGTDQEDQAQRSAQERRWIDVGCARRGRGAAGGDGEHEADGDPGEGDGRDEELPFVGLR